MEIKSPRQLTVIALATLLLLPILFVTAPAMAQSTYNVMIRSPLKNGLTPTTSVPIIMDGQPTNHSTPWDFMGLTGVHNFTVPYEDASGHPFKGWTNTFLGINGAFTTITLSPQNASSDGFYYAQYNAVLNLKSMTWPETRCFITPKDPAVIAAAGNMTWDEIVDWVAINISPAGELDHYQFPNETLAVGSGVCREYSGLAVSMLEARGYKAYIVAGNTTGHLDINHAWIAIELNGTLYHYEPQETWNQQPEPLVWAENRTAWFFYNDKVFIPATATQDLPAPPPTDIYRVTIITKASADKTFQTGRFDVNAPIFLDGRDTGYLSPHTFTGLKGNHTFAVGYKDTKGNVFYAWDTAAPSNRWFQSIAISHGGIYSALFSTEIDIAHPSPAQWQYLITSQDKAVVAAAKDKNWSQIVDYVSSLPLIRPHVNGDPVLFPNQTLNGGYFLPDYTLLCCSMLLANGYNAYYAGKTENFWPAWIVLEINGTLTPISPYAPSAAEVVAWIKADYYANQTGMYPATFKENPGVFAQTAKPSPSVQPNTTPSPSSTSNPTSTPNPTTPSPSPTQPPQATPAPSATIPEYPAITAVTSILALTALTLVLMRRATKKHSQPILS